MSTDTITIRGYSKTSFEEALEDAIKQLPQAITTLHDYKIVQSGKEVGGVAGRNVVIESK